MPRHRAIKVELLNVCDAYQRTVKRRIVSQIAKSYDASAFGSLIVGERTDGTLWVVDGQQRLVAAKQLSHRTVPCSVIPSRGSAHEAAIFRRVNGGRQTISRNELFRAALEAGDSQSVAIVAAVERAGFELRLNQGPGGASNLIRAAAPLETLYGWGELPLLERVLSCIKGAWIDEPAGTQSFAITGLGRFFRMYPDALDKRVVAVLKRIAPHHIARHADDARLLMGGSRDAVIARVIAIQYNKRLKTSNQLVVRDEAGATDK